MLILLTNPIFIIDYCNPDLLAQIQNLQYLLDKEREDRKKAEEVIKWIWEWEKIIFTNHGMGIHLELLHSTNPF